MQEIGTEYVLQRIVQTVALVYKRPLSSSDPDESDRSKTPTVQFCTPSSHLFSRFSWRDVFINNCAYAFSELRYLHCLRCEQSSRCHLKILPETPKFQLVLAMPIT